MKALDTRAYSRAACGLSSVTHLMKKDKLFVRIILLLAGAFFLGLGVALSIRSMLGTSPIDSFPYVMSLVAPQITVGTYTILLNVLFLLLQGLILGRHFGMRHLLEIPAVASFGLFIDLSMWLTEGLPAETYVVKMILTLVSCVACAVGVYMMVRSEVTSLAGDGLCLAISWRWSLDFGKVKIYFDIIHALIAIILSVVCLHGIYGVREGTIIAALLVGYLVTLLEKYDPIIDKLLGRE